MKILVLNGPNLNLLGTREPEVYGTDTLEDIQKNLQSISSKKSVSIEFYQSNSENELINRLHEAKKDLVDIDRLSAFLFRIKNKIKVNKLDRASALAFSLLFEYHKETPDKKELDNFYLEKLENELLEEVNAI